MFRYRVYLKYFIRIVIYWDHRESNTDRRSIGRKSDVDEVSE